MTYDLIKYSLPGRTKSYKTKEELVDVLRAHICESCLIGPSIYVDENGKEAEFPWSEDPVVDVEYEGQWFHCRDIKTLLGTPCGCEYGVEIDGAGWLEYEH